MATLNELTVLGNMKVTGMINATAEKALCDSDGDNIYDTYARRGAVSITDSNLSTYYNSTTRVLTVPANTTAIGFLLSAGKGAHSSFPNTLYISAISPSGGRFYSGQRLKVLSLVGNRTYPCMWGVGDVSYDGWLYAAYYMGSYTTATVYPRM